jgi:hypothetical protein
MHRLLWKFFECRWNLRSGVWALPALWYVGFAQLGAQQPADPGTSATGAVRNVRGAIVVAVTFDADGKVAGCQLLRSDAPYPLEASTIDHIRKHWKVPLFAGDTIVLPIVYPNPPTPDYWIEDMANPPDLFPFDDKTYTMKLRLTFGNDGWVRDAQVQQKSGIDLADAQTAAWVKVHWHHSAYANQVLDAPFQFSRLASPAPAPPPPPPVLQPAKPAAPPEPVPIPAIRVQ